MWRLSIVFERSRHHYTTVHSPTYQLMGTRQPPFTRHICKYGRAVGMSRKPPLLDILENFTCILTIKSLISEKKQSLESIIILSLIYFFYMYTLVGQSLEQIWHFWFENCANSRNRFQLPDVLGLRYKLNICQNSQTSFVSTGLDMRLLHTKCYTTV